MGHWRGRGYSLASTTIANSEYVTYRISDSLGTRSNSIRTTPMMQFVNVEDPINTPPTDYFWQRLVRLTDTTYGLDSRGATVGFQASKNIILFLFAQWPPSSYLSYKAEDLGESLISRCPARSSSAGMELGLSFRATFVNTSDSRIQLPKKSFHFNWWMLFPDGSGASSAESTSLVEERYYFASLFIADLIVVHSTT
jgi:hypothetical protein